MDDHTLILTANRRLASTLHHTYAQQQREQNKQTWKTPHILPLTTWLTLLWSQQHADTLLNEFQETLLWKNITQQAWPTLTHIQQAWKQVHLWSVSLDEFHHYHNDNSDAFLQWANTFKQHCIKGGYITQAEIPAQLGVPNQLPSHIQLLGFDTLPPAITHFLERINTHTEFDIQRPTSHKKNHIQRLALNTTEDEIHSMATWAKAQYDQNPTQTIGCIVPNLEEIRTPVYRIFSQICQHTTLFNISAAEPLTAYPLINLACEILMLSEENKLTPAWNLLWHTPYLAESDDDLEMSAALDKRRREMLPLYAPVSTLLPLLTALHSSYPKSTWLKRWQRFIKLRQQCSNLKSPSEWSHIFLILLQALGWPGQRTRSSIEHQLIDRFLRSLEEFEYCDPISPKLTWSEAVHLFKQQLHQTRFQPKTPHAPIQILGVLESTGMQFDHLWVMGLQANAWPPPAKPNPFIPIPLQIRYKMPHASADRELLFTQNTMQRLLNSAPQIILSHPRQVKDHPCQPSSFIQSYASRTLEDLDLTQNQIPFEHALLEWQDNQAPPLTTNEPVKGGSTLLKHQALCPFRAFAHARLGAQALESPQLGLSASEKGQFLHRALERIWSSLKTQEALLGLKKEALENTVDAAISHTINDFNRNQSTTSIFTRSLALEKIRLTTLLLKWLSYEKERLPFKVIETEAKRSASLGPFTLHLKIDRIDELPNGDQVIIDYKTGNTSTKYWFDERLSEPQLPLYCTYGQPNQPYTGITYAQIRPEKVSFKGIAMKTSQSLPSGIEESEDWDALISNWKERIGTLAQAFASGQAQVDPINQACMYCQLQPLCRVRR